MSEGIDLDQIRSRTLDRIDRAERNFKLAFLAAATFEAFFVIAFLLLMERHNRTHILILISAIGGYTVVVLGLVALGAHFNRGVLRLLKMLEPRIKETEGQ